MNIITIFSGGAYLLKMCILLFRVRVIESHYQFAVVRFLVVLVEQGGFRVSNMQVADGMAGRYTNNQLSIVLGVCVHGLRVYFILGVCLYVWRA